MVTRELETRVRNEMKQWVRTNVPKHKRSDFKTTFELTGPYLKQCRYTLKRIANEMELEYKENEDEQVSEWTAKFIKDLMDDFFDGKMY